MLKNCTKYCQPWDLLGDQPFKSYSKRLTLYIKQGELDIQNDIGITRAKCSMMVSQFRYPRYIVLIQHAFYKAVHRTEYAPFETPEKFWFRFEYKNYSKCNYAAFIRYSWYLSKFCFKHFLFYNSPFEIKYHYCENNVIEEYLIRY